MLAFESSERTASLVESEIVLIALFADCCVLDGEKEVDADDESFWRFEPVEWFADEVGAEVAVIELIMEVLSLSFRMRIDRNYTATNSSNANQVRPGQA